MTRMPRGPLLAAFVAATIASQAAGAAAPPRYSTRQVGDVVQLRDARANMTVSVLTGVNNAYEIVANGRNVLRMVIGSVAEMRARPGLNGVPLLAPFANRLDETAFYANGQKYNFDLELGNVRSPQPIHGFLQNATAWKVIDSGSNRDGSWVTSRLEFYRIPQYMKQFPFAHTLTLTYRLANGALEVHTRIDNLSSEPMPVAIGFHPYFQLTDSTRNDWTLDVGAKLHWVKGANRMPSGETEPAERFWGGDPHQVPLARFATTSLDELFTDLERDRDGIAHVGLSGRKQMLTVKLGPKFKALLVFSQVPGTPPRPDATPLAPIAADPRDPPLTAPEEPAPLRGFVAIEPMVGVTNSMNLAQRGLYNDLQRVAPGGSWEESFWIEPGERP